jgi:hypothetical protein
MNLDILTEYIGLPQEAVNIVKNYSMAEDEFNEIRRIFHANTGLFIEKISSRHDFRQCFLYLYCRLAVEAYEQYRLKNIEDEVYFDTFKDITIWCENCFSYFGEYGIGEYRWLLNHVKLGIFRLGRLQFQPVSLDKRIDFKDYTIEPGELVLNVHIPQGQPLDEKECDRSFERAKAFFRGAGTAFVCHSWLLYPGLKDILPGDSNIIRFQNRFHIYSTNYNSRQGEERIFGRIQDSPELYPEATSLQKRAKEYLISGKKIGMGSGIIFS